MAKRRERLTRQASRVLDVLKRRPEFVPKTGEYYYGAEAVVCYLLFRGWRYDDMEARCKQILFEDDLEYSEWSEDAFLADGHTMTNHFAGE